MENIKFEKSPNLFLFYFIEFVLIFTFLFVIVKLIFEYKEIIKNKIK